MSIRPHARKTEMNIGNEELAEKLNSELRIETGDQQDGLREDLKEYLDNCAFQLEDIPGREEVSLTRTYGDEKCVGNNSGMEIRDDGGG